MKIILALMLLTNIAFAGVASTDYVDSKMASTLSQAETKIAEAIATLRQQIPSLKKFAIGELYSGGIIFWLDESKNHGLIAALNDYPGTLSWQNGEGGEKVTNAQSRGIYGGKMNTALIIAQQTLDEQDGVFAALAASQFAISLTGKKCKALPSRHFCLSDWYLPAADELRLIYQNLYLAGLTNFSGKNYWSSTEDNANQAWALNFASGEIKTMEKNNLAQLRAIRSF